MAKINKAKINKVGHVVLGCRDPQASIKFYTETLGMEPSERAATSITPNHGQAPLTPRR